MHANFDTPLLALARVSVILANKIPRKISNFLMLRLIRTFIIFTPRYRRIGIRNLSRAYPDKDLAWQEETLRGCDRSLAQLLVDFARTDSINAVSAKIEFEFPFHERLQQLKAAGTSVIYTTGHLGSFELMAQYIALSGHPFNFVVRKFKIKALDVWWTKRREINGNRTIQREGALKNVLRALKAKREVGVLFDQNVTRDHAAFVPWFGMPAATTRLIGIAALKTRAAVVLLSMQYLGDGRYRANTLEKDFTEIYDSNFDQEQKVNLITESISKEYVALIRNNPSAWFWMHRRWKTTPEGTPEIFYDGM